MREGRLEQWEKDLIYNMRNDNKGYIEISKRLNCKKDRVKDYCQANGLGGFRAKDLDPENAYDNFIKNFNVTYGDRYLYIGGYTHSDNDLIIECKTCHTQMSRNACTIRHGKPLNCQCELKAIREEREAKQSLIDILMKRYNNIVRENNRIILTEAREEQRQKDLTTVCQECGEIFQATSMGMKYCSNRCKERSHGRMKDISRRWRIRENGKVDKDITLTKLIKRDKGICHICNKKCDSKDYVRTEEGYFVVGKDYPSLDHIIPISKGGTHTWDNVKLAHHYCNSIKSNNEAYEEGTGQLKIVM